MKNITILAACLLGLAFLQSCGKNEIGTNLVHDLGKGIEFVGQQPKNFGRTVLGVNEDKRESDNRDNELSQADEYLQEQIDALLSSVGELYSLVGSIEADQDTLSQDIALNVLKLAELESNDSIVEFVDPCGDNPNKFDEILMVTSTGKYVAYFESGGERFLTVLPNGSYRTTDAQKCNFSIVNGAYVE